MTIVSPDKYRVTAGDIAGAIMMCIVPLIGVICLFWLSIINLSTPDSSAGDYVTLVIACIFTPVTLWVIWSEITKTRALPKKRHAADQAELDWKILLKAFPAHDTHAIEQVYRDEDFEVFIVNRHPTQRIICHHSYATIRIRPEGKTAIEATSAVLERLDEANKTHITVVDA